jgi:hypothetical protein
VNFILRAGYEMLSYFSFHQLPLFMRLVLFFEFVWLFRNTMQTYRTDQTKNETELIMKNKSKFVD